MVAGTAEAELLELVEESLVETSSVAEDELFCVEVVEDVEVALLVVLLTAVVVAARAANPDTSPTIARMLVVRAVARARAAGCRRFRVLAVLFMPETLPHEPGAALRLR